MMGSMGPFTANKPICIFYLLHSG